VTEGEAAMPAIATPVRLGLRQNLGQFALLVAVSALVGGMVGQERTVLPLLATDVAVSGLVVLVRMRETLVRT
jgi:hypothetical protein